MFALTNSKPRTHKAAAEAVAWLKANFEYEKDEGEDWSIDYACLERGLKLRDDCDGFVNALTRLLFKYCDFGLHEIAICLTDVDPLDDARFDHIVVGVKVGRWYFAHNWSPLLLERYQVERGGYPSPDLDPGQTAAGMRFEQSRILNRGRDGWLSGSPQ